MYRLVNELPLGATKICTFSSVDVALFYFNVLRTAKVSFIASPLDYNGSLDLYVMKDKAKRAKQAMETASRFIDYSEASAAHTFLYFNN